MYLFGEGFGIAMLKEHEGPVHACAFSPDGRQIVSASSDGTLRFWGAATGEILETKSIGSGWTSLLSGKPGLACAPRALERASVLALD